MIVYDLDRTMVVDENLGEIILTGAFKQYTKTRNYQLYFCRKADPQSKGKVENVIQYIKKNFLYNRVYNDIETLNERALSWLNRTANHLPHNCTKEPPKEAFLTEKEYLRPYIPLTHRNAPKMKKYTLRKNNEIAYKSNFYTLPQGTYQGPNSAVLVKEEEGKLCIYDLKENFICSHQISLHKGKTIRNTHHKRDTSKSLEEMAGKVIAYFTDGKLAGDYIFEIKQRWPRYLRDHLQVILKSLEKTDTETANKTLDFCLKNKILHGHEFEQTLQVFMDEKVRKPMAENQIKLLSATPKNIDCASQTSDIGDYEKIMNAKNVEK